MDENYSDHIDGLFKEGLDPVENEPSRQVWEKIDNALDKDRAGVYLFRYRLVLGIASFLLLACTTLGILFRHKNGDQGKPTAHFKAPDTTEVRSPVMGARQRFGLPGAGVAAGKSAATKPATSGATVTSTTATKAAAAGAAAAGATVTGTTAAGASVTRTTARGIALTGYAGTTSGLPLAGVDGDLSQGSVSPFRRPVSDLTAGRQALAPMNYSLLGERSRIPVAPMPAAKAGAMLVRQARRLAATAYFSQEFVGYNLSDNDSSAADGKTIEKNERSVFSASVGVLVDYKWKKKWVIQSGFSYSWSRSIINPSTYYAVRDNNGDVKYKINTISGYGYLPPPGPANVGDSVLTDKSTCRLHYLTVPLIVSYDFNFGRFSLLSGLGGTFNLLTSATVESKISGVPNSLAASVFPLYGLKKINYGVLVKEELEYSITPAWGINLMANFKNVLSPVNIHTSLSAYPYNFGIGLGITRTF